MASHKNKPKSSFVRSTSSDTAREHEIHELLQEAKRMQAMQYVVSGTTKELQYPLLAILRKIEAFEQKYAGRSFEYVSFKDFEQIMDFLKLIRQRIQSCYDTTAKLAKLNKKRLKFETDHCQPNAVVREILRSRGKNLRFDNVRVRLKLLETLPLIAIGELELDQILNHLIDNAVQAMPAGGQLMISSSVSNKNEVKIDVSDDGVGISAEDLPHIFEPFFTSQPRTNSGAGLGLSIVYSLVKAAHGQIKVKSSLRKGTVVSLVFPIC